MALGFTELPTPSVSHADRHARHLAPFVLGTKLNDVTRILRVTTHSGASSGIHWAAKEQTLRDAPSFRRVARSWLSRPTLANE